MVFWIQRNLLFLICLCSVFSYPGVKAIGPANSGSHGRNPYAVLGVSRDASQEEIRAHYRNLCLKYHPDKNTQRPVSERIEAEQLFKELQTAYESIGTPDARRAFDDSLRQQQQFQTSAAASRGPYRQFYYSEPMAEAFARSFRTYSTHRGGYPYYRLNAGEDIFSRPTGGFPMWGGSSALKSTYLQRVNVPLKDLYNGKRNMKFRLRENILTRYCAAFRGRIGFVLLYQSLLYALPLLRVMGKWAALAMATYLFHAQIPVASFTDAMTFEAPIMAGYKAGTRYKFKSPSDPRVEVVFVLSEEKDRKFYRTGNDIHVHATISRRDAKKGCTMNVESLDENTPFVQVDIPAGLIKKSGQTLTIHGKGWPIRSSGGKGDLIVHFRLVRGERWKATGH